MRTHIHRRAAAALNLFLTSGAALAGGSPENILLIVNPQDPQGMYLANYYKNARNIPDQNVLYMEPTATSNSTLPAPYTRASGLNGDLDGFNGFMSNLGIGNHIDYVVVCNPGCFYTDAPGYVLDGCSPVTKFSQSSVYTMAFMKSTILAGNLSVGSPNQYYSPSPDNALAFSSSTLYLNGAVTTGSNGRRYYIGAQLGYTGPLGNTVPELLAMIDRAVASDGTRPPGTFYFMSTTDSIRNVRSPQFTGAVNSIVARGGLATVLNGVLPDNHLDNLGIMTGWADPPVDTAPIAPQPGSFCDHLTSWAATFDIADQTKVSSWIRRGAAGSAGAVQEPCNYTGKFPNASMHAQYFAGLSLGEAYLRSVAFVPFQGLLYGDPMARPWATLPLVVGNGPSGTVSGQVLFTPAASTTLSGAAIAGVSAYLDGVLLGTKAPGQAFAINTLVIDDGWHELRVLAWDNTAVKNTGRWVGSFSVNNLGRSASIGMNTATGSMTTLFSATAGGAGAAVQQLRLIQNGRVVAAGATGPLEVYGSNLGAGVSRLQVEAQFVDGRIARSTPTSVTIDPTQGVPLGQAPVAYSYTKRVARGGPFVVELPARFDDAVTGATYAIETPPGQGTTVGLGQRGTRVMTAAANACGQDQFTFRVYTPSGQSNLATVTLVYGPGQACPVDMFADGSLNVIDFSAFLNYFAANDLRADIDSNCTLNVLDFNGFLNGFAAGCPWTVH